MPSSSLEDGLLCSGHGPFGQVVLEEDPIWTPFVLKLTIR